MADVNVTVSGDAKKAEQAFDALNSKVAALESRLKKTGGTSRKMASESDQAFGSMLKSVVSYAAAIGLVVKAFSGAIEKAKELRSLRDQTTVSVDKSLVNIYKELNITDKSQQKAMSDKVFKEALNRKLSVAGVSDIYAAAANDGINQKDIQGGKIDPVLELLKTSENIDPKELFAIVQGGLRKQGIKNADKQDYQKIAEKFSTFGRDLPELQKLIAETEGNKKVSLDEIMALYDLGKKDKAGNAKKTISEMHEKLQKGGLPAAVKSTGFTMEEFRQNIEDRTATAEQSFNAKKLIYDNSRQAELTYSETARSLAFDKKDKPLEQALKNIREGEAEASGTNEMSRWAQDQAASMFGEQAAKSFLDGIVDKRNAISVIVNENRQALGLPGQNDSDKQKADLFKATNKPIDRFDTKEARAK